jgi:GNAT superfamily N-acetyltransferase
MPPYGTAQLLAIFDQQQRQEVEFFDARREVLARVVRLIPIEGPSGGGAVIYSCLNADNADAAIREQTLYFDSQGLDFAWKVYDHDTPADLQTRLAAHGFEPEDPEAVLVLDLEDAPPILWQPITHDVRLIEDPARIDDVMAVQEGVWEKPFPWLAEHLKVELGKGGELIRVYVAYVDGAPASTAWIRLHPPSRFASLWGGSTLPDFRKRGLYTALLAVRAQEARRRGARFLTVDASPMSQPILEKLGFRCISHARDYNWHTSRPAA